jgi:hypothetical protein
MGHWDLAPKDFLLLVFHGGARIAMWEGEVASGWWLVVFSNLKKRTQETGVGRDGTFEFRIQLCDARWMGSGW